MLENQKAVNTFPSLPLKAVSLQAESPGEHVFYHYKDRHRGRRLKLPVPQIQAGKHAKRYRRGFTLQAEISQKQIGLAREAISVPRPPRCSTSGPWPSWVRASQESSTAAGTLLLMMTWLARLVNAAFKTLHCDILFPANTKSIQKVSSKP